MVNPAHFKWDAGLRNLAQEIRASSPNSAIAAERFNAQTGAGVSALSLRAALGFEKDRDKRNAQKRAQTARPASAVEKKKRPCLNACGRTMISEGPGHRLCDPCSSSMSSLPAQFS